MYGTEEVLDYTLTLAIIQTISWLHKNVSVIIDTFRKTYTIKKIGPSEYNLGCDYFQLERKNGKVK